MQLYITIHCLVLQILYVGSDRPEITQLHSHVKWEVSPNWYDLGVQLLNTEQAKKLKTIKVDHPGDSEKCCTELFAYWLQVDTNASWDKLIIALQQIDYVVLADRIRAMTSEGVQLYRIIATGLLFIT